MAITMKDIANETGVSVATVSHVINGTKKISDATKRLVTEAVERHNYVPDSSAKNLRRQKTKTAALVVSSHPDLYITGLINGVGMRARELGYNLLFVNTSENENNEKETVQLLRSNMVDGIILSPTTNRIDHLQDLLKQRFPVVLVNRYDPRYEDVPRVTADDHQAGYDATAHLIQHGHRHIGLIYAVPDVTTTANRIDGYRDALRQNGLTVNEGWIVRGFGTVEGGQLAVKLLMDTAPQITALFVMNDYMVIGAVQALRNLSLRIPSDVALIGFGDFEAAAVIDPPITNVSLPPETIGKTAFDVLVNKISNPEYRKHVSLPTSLIIRKSCGC
jgi:LacI family transcriptional regulator